MITSLNNIPLVLNIEVSFNLKSTTDRQTWRGQLVAVGGFDVANTYNDVLAAHNNMIPAVAKLEPVSLTYIVIRTADGALRPFATDWIEESTFNRTDNVEDIQVIIHNINGAAAANVLGVIRDLGYEVTVVS
jgi:hypothetical protein